MDERDKKLLNLLSQDARQSISTLASNMGIARTTLQARLEKLERDGIIAGYGVRLGQSAKADRIAATVLVQMKPGAVASVVAKLKQLSAVQMVRTCSGRFDLILDVVADTTASLDNVLDRIGEISEVESSESLIHLSEKLDRRAI